MEQRFVPGIAAAVVAAVVTTAAQDRGRPGPAAANRPMDCAALTGLQLPDVAVTTATPVAAATTGAVRAAHCRVEGVIGTEIRFTLLLPEEWNGRFFMGGGGGFVGSVQNSAETTVNQGYATVGTDTGHRGAGTDASWAYNNLERRINFGYLAVHRTAETAKAIVARYYGSRPAKNYFTGCSRGGGQALMEAQRYPADFDGIVAGAPAYDWTGIAAQMVANGQAAFPNPKKLEPMFTAEEMQLVEARVLESCDARDGLADGIIADPRTCAFDVNSLPLSEAKRTALKTLYAPITTRDGEIHPGQPFGGEGQRGGWPMWIVGGPPQPPGQKEPSLRLAFGAGIFKYLVFNDPEWDYSTYELANWKKDTALAATYLNATNPDLSAFKARGGRLIMWHGWADPALTPLATLKYHDQVYARDPDAASFARTFMLPGVLHCAGGAGPDTVDWPAAIAGWVEQGKAPERVVARKIVNGAATRSRPLCAHPQKAEYKGAGSADDEASFVCR
jgi:feruloyl esterase